MGQILCAVRFFRAFPTTNKQPIRFHQMHHNQAPPPWGIGPLGGRRNDAPTQPSRQIAIVSGQPGHDRPRALSPRPSIRVTAEPPIPTKQPTVPTDITPRGPVMQPNTSRASARDVSCASSFSAPKYRFQNDAKPQSDVRGCISLAATRSLRPPSLPDTACSPDSREPDMEVSVVAAFARTRIARTPRSGERCYG